MSQEIARWDLPGNNRSAWKEGLHIFPSLSELVTETSGNPKEGGVYAAAKKKALYLSRVRFRLRKINDSAMHRCIR